MKVLIGYTGFVGSILTESMSFDLLLNSEYYLKQLSTKLLFLIVSKNKHFIKKDIKILVDSEIKDTD